MALVPKSTESPEHQVLGDSKVKDFARIWDLHAEDFHLVSAKGLYDWITDKKFTPEELEAFKQGLAVIPMFMSECDNHIQKKLKEQELKNSLKV